MNSTPDNDQISNNAIDWPYSRRARRSSRQPISYLMEQASYNPNLISLAAGLVDYDMLPLARTRDVIEAIYESPKDELKRLLQYGTTEGDPRLRELLLTHLSDLDQLDYRSMGYDESDMIVTSGSQQLLFLISDILLDDGDIVITEGPSYFVYAGTLETLGARVMTVPMDENGMRHDALQQILSELEASGDISRLKIVYHVTYHQNPTGITMSEQRKAAVTELLSEYQSRHPFLVVEDAAYRELTYTGQVPVSMKAYASLPDALPLEVAQLMTFSKPYAPGFKTGYGLLPKGMMQAIVNLKGNHDFGSSNLCQHILREAMSRGDYQAHVKEACQHYQHKLNLMLVALEKHFSHVLDDVSWTRPSGGLYVYVTFPEEIDTSTEGEFFDAAMREGVLYVPGIYGHFGSDSGNGTVSEIRLSFGLARPEAIEEGVARLARAYDSVRQPS